MDRLQLRRGEIGTLRQARGRRAEFGPAPIKIDQVARSDLLLWLVRARFVAAPGIIHADKLIQVAVLCCVKKA